MEQDSKKNRVDLVKTNLFLHYISHAYEKSINKFGTSQILKIKKIN